MSDTNESTKVLRKVASDLGAKMSNIDPQIAKGINDLETVTTICNNMAGHLRAAVEGSNSRETAEESYKTLIANIQVIHDALLKEPQKLQADLDKLRAQKVVFEETIMMLSSEAESVEKKEARKQELVEKVASGEIDQPREPGQRPEKLRDIREAKKEYERQTLAGLTSIEMTESQGPEQISED